MADTNHNDTPPATNGAGAPPGGTEFTPAEPLKTAGVEFDPAPATGATASTDGVATGDRLADARQAIVDRTADLRDQAGEKARSLVDDGKVRATDALGQLSQMLHDAAGQVDDKLGADYGQYARAAAEKVSGLSAAIEAKDMDALLEDARTLVRRSPVAAVGAAAAVGFVVARLFAAGLDARDRA